MRNFLISLVLLLGLFSCTNEGQHKYKVAVSQCSKDNWRRTANEEFLREASFLKDIDLEIRAVSDNSEAQIRDVEDFISEKVDLLIISPNESSKLTPVVNKAYKNGIPVILYDRKIDSDQYSAYVGADNRQIGSQIGYYVQGHFIEDNQTCNILIVRGTKGSTADIERYDGLMSALKNIKNVHVIGSVYGNFLKDDAYRQVKSMLQSELYGKHVDVVIAFNDAMASGAHNAFLEKNSHGSVPAIIGVDALPGESGGINLILNGQITASFMYPTGGDAVINVANNILKGKPYARQNLLNTAAVDMTNARVLKLQYDQIENRQKQIDTLNLTLGDSQDILRTYKIYLLITLILLMIIIVAVASILTLYRTKSRLNVQLNEQNEQIRIHLKELEKQKEELIGLSRQLEDATNAKLVFFTDISHELKTPLTLILGPLKEILSDDKLDTGIQVKLKLIERNADRLYSLINEILEFRTIENGKMPVKLQNGDLKSFLDELNKLFSGKIEDKHIDFAFETRGKDFNIPFDAKKLEKIYSNLMSNALKHVKAGGRIRSSLARVSENGSDKIIVNVYNSDSYIPEDKIKDIFLRFYKIGEESGNTGIGLALTYQLVTLLGGEVKVKSSEEKGTSFTVTLPVSSEEAKENYAGDIDHSYTVRKISDESFGNRVANDEIDEINEVSSGREKVLVIEDNPDMLHYIKDILSADYSVILANGGVSGLEKFKKYSPDIVLCDIMMPEMDGFEVCSRIKGNEMTRHIPVILLTASGLDEHKEKGYECGADAYMQKPFNAKVLKVRIRKLLDKAMSDSQGYDWLIGNSMDLSDDKTMLLSRIKDYVEKHLQDDITLDDLLTELGMSKSNFYRKLKEITDWTPVDIISLIRLRCAVNLAMHGGKNLSQAAFESGFNSLSYFSRTFVKYYQISPREWIKMQLGK